ncbi:MULTISPECIES: hypothetical protein [unclassified Actinotignum]|uniref:hypothetical protein n=1 Tax=unclassified Actinotignum TaxID=2632702 RepID=UPI003F458668
MITAKEAVYLAAKRLHEFYPKDKITSRGWAEDDEYYIPMLSRGRIAKGEPRFLVNKQTGEVEEFHYLPNLPIAARLEAMKRTKYLFRRVIIRPRRFNRMWNTLFRKD